MSCRPAVYHDRFLAGGIIGRGRFAEVLRVRDLLTDADVALKRLLTADAGARASFRAELRLLTELDHPGFPRVWDLLESDEDGLAFSMELLEGGSLASRAPLGPAEALAATREALDALAVLHDRGLIHGDLSPANLHYGGGPASRLKLIDLGLAVRAERSGITGTLAHLAPEVLQGAAADPRSDLYALASSLRQAITGQPPLGGEDVVRMLEARVDRPPPPLAGMGLIHEGLGQALDRMMDLDPAARPADAWDALGLLGDLGLGKRGATPRLPPGWAPADPRAVAAATEAAAGGPGGVLWIDAEGEDVHGLARAVTAAFQLSGRRAQLAPVGRPLGWAWALAPASLLMEGSQLGIRQPAGATALGLPGGAPPPEPVAAVAALLQEACAGGHRIGVVVADGSEDEPSVELLARLGPELPALGAWVVVVAAPQRTGAAAELPARLSRMDVAPLTVTCQPLTAEAVTAALAGAFGQAGVRLAPGLHEASGGRPTLLRGVTRQLVVGGALYRAGRLWSVDEDEAAIVLAREPSRLEDDAPWLAGLGNAARAALRWASLLGRATTPEELAELSGAPVGMLQAGLAEAEEAGLWARQPGGGGVHPPTLGRWIARGMDPREAAPMRRQLAQGLIRAAGQGPSPAQAGEIAELLLAAADPAALPWGMIAAGGDQDRHLFGRARDLYRRLAPLVGDSAHARPLRLAWAACAQRLGDFGEAAEVLEPEAREILGASTPAPGADARFADAEILQRWGAALTRCGRWEEAVDALAHATALLGADGPLTTRLAVLRDSGLARYYQGDASAAASLLREGLRLCGALEPGADAHTWGASRIRLPADEAPARCALELIHTLAAVTWQQGRHVDAEALVGEALMQLGADPRAPSAGDITDGPLAEAEANLWVVLGNVATDLGRPDDATAAIWRALRFYEGSGRLQAAARCYNNLATIEVHRSSFGEAIEQWERFRRLSDRGRDAADVAVVLNNLGNAYLQRGDLERAEGRLKEALATSERAGYARIRGQILGNMGELAFRSGDPRGAMALYDRALDISRRLGVKDDEAESLRRRAEVLLEQDRWAEAREVCELGLGVASEAGCAAEAANLTALRGLLGVMLGREAEGVGDLEVAGERLEALGLRLEWARARYLLARGLAWVDQLEGADRVLAEAVEVFDALGAGWDARRGRALWDELDRQDGAVGGSRRSLRILLDVSRSLASELDLERLLSLIVARALEVTGAQRGFIILFDDEGRPTFRAARQMGREEVEGASSRISSTVVRRVLESGAPFAVTNVDEDTDLRDQLSVQALGLRSIMAAPLRRSATTLGIIYVDSPHVIRRFRHRELELLEALAETAAVAVENAQLYRDLKRKTDLMYYMAHEFRNPLTAVLSFADLILSDGANLRSDQRDFLGIIGQQGRRLARMVSSVLDLAKLEANRVEWAVEAVPVPALIREVVVALSPLAQERRIRVEVTASAGPPVYGSRDRLAQVLTNLVGNAIKFVEEGGWIGVAAEVVVLTPQARAEAHIPSPDSWIRRNLVPGRALSEGRAMEITVADDGPGIPPEALGTIFDQFSQTGSAASRKKGTGLGLAIVREIIEHHGGWIRAENRPEGGALFRLQLPLMEDG